MANDEGDTSAVASTTKFMQVNRLKLIPTKSSLTKSIKLVPVKNSELKKVYTMISKCRDIHIAYKGRSDSIFPLAVWLD